MLALMIQQQMMVVTLVIESLLEMQTQAMALLPTQIMNLLELLLVLFLLHLLAPVAQTLTISHT
jgi:hypothetical protein